MSYSEWSETRRRFTATDFQLCIIICYYEGRRKSERTRIGWNTPTIGLCLQRWAKTNAKVRNTEDQLQVNREFSPEV